MDTNETHDQKPKRTPDDVWNDIEKFLSTTDGIATADAFRLGKLVKEYGERCAGEATAEVMKPILDMIKRETQPKPPKQPWE